VVLEPPLLGPGELPPGGPKATPYYLGGWPEWVWAARGLFGYEIAVLVEGMYVVLFICC